MRHHRSQNVTATTLMFLHNQPKAHVDQQGLLGNSVAWVHEQTMPTERTPHVGEVSAKFYG
jgi:hypothetical protein